MSSSLSPRGLAALSVLLAGSSVASAQSPAPAPHTVVVSNPLSPTPTVDPVANPTGATALTPSIGLNPADRLLLPAVQKYNALSIGESDKLKPHPNVVTIFGAKNSGHATERIEISWETMELKAGRQSSIVIADKSGKRYADSLVIAPNPGTAAPVQIIPINDPSSRRSFFPFGPSFTGGVNVATGDLNGDGYDDILVGGGPGGGPIVKLFDGATLQYIGKLPTPNSPNSVTGVSVAIADLDNDGTPEIITGSGPGGGPHVKVFSGAEVLAAFLTGATPAPTLDYDLPPDYELDNVFVTAGDLDGDGRAEVILNPAGNLKSGLNHWGDRAQRILRLSPISNALEIAGTLQLPSDTFGPGYDGATIAIPADIDDSSPGQELVITAYSSLVSIPEPASLPPLLASAMLLTSHRRLTSRRRR